MYLSKGTIKRVGVPWCDLIRYGSTVFNRVKIRTRRLPHLLVFILLYRIAGVRYLITHNFYLVRLGATRIHLVFYI